MEPPDKLFSNVVVIGASAGGMNALRKILKELPVGYELPVIVVQHISPQSDSYWIENLGKDYSGILKEVEDKETIQKGHVYVAPPNYHLLVDYDATFTLSAEAKVNFSRPSIDVLFETASDVFGKKVIGVLLTGSSKDGAAGMKKIKDKGGVLLVEDPSTAEYPVMPQSALDIVKADFVLPVDAIAKWLAKLK